MKRKIFYSESADVYPGIVARNNAVVEYERFVHRTFYPYMIHPYSHFRVVWEKWHMALINIRMVLTPIVWATIPHHSWIYQLVMIIVCVSNFIDVILNFLTGYIDYSVEVTVLEPRRVVRRYLLTYFIFDVLPTIQAIFYIFYTGNYITTTCPDRYAGWEFYEDILVQLVYLRFLTFLRYYIKLSKILLWNVFLVGVVSVSLLIIYTLQLASSGYRIMLIEYGCTNVTTYGKVISWSDTLDYLRTYGDDFVMFILDCYYKESTLDPRFTPIRTLVLVSSFFSNIVLVSFFLKYVMLQMASREKELNMESRVMSFVRAQHLSRILENKILLYFRIVLENKAYGEDEIENYIPDTFKADIFFHLCLPLLKNFHPFDELPTHVLRRMAESMNYQLYLPNEVVMHRDEYALNMYFVHRGTIALYSPKNVELYHFEEGSSFNGRNVILGEFSAGNYAISMEVAEVYSLSYDDFLDIMRSYPRLFYDMKRKVAEEKTVPSYLL